MDLSEGRALGEELHFPGNKFDCKSVKLIAKGRKRVARAK
jgi:hypothetical protein